MRPAPFLCAALVLGAAALAAPPARAQSVDPGYHVVDLVPFGLVSPRALTFLPDGRVLVAERTTGRIRVVKNGALLPAPFADVPVNSAGDRGALGLAAAPDFGTSGRVYFYYARSSTGVDTNVPGQVSDLRLVRFTASGDTALAGSETSLRLFPTPPALPDHVGGGLRFGPEGALYLGLGTCDALPNPALDLASLFGKLLRLDPQTAQAWPDNPFALDGDPNTLADVFAFGLHDPAYFSIYVYDVPGPPKIVATDAGDAGEDEVNEIVAGKDYGYPIVQGRFDTAAESAYVASHVRYRPPTWSSGASAPRPTGVAAAIAEYGFFPFPALFWGQAMPAAGPCTLPVAYDVFTLPGYGALEDFGSGFAPIADVSFPIRFPMTFLPDFDSLYVAAGNALYLVRPNGVNAVTHFGAGVGLAHAGAHPARGATGIACTLPDGSRGRIEIADVAGRSIRRLAPEIHGPGTTVVRWDGSDGFGRNAPAGLYFARLVLPDGTAAARLSIVRLP
jgi:glucose/arabinose dehydrogenase